MKHLLLTLLLATLCVVSASGQTIRTLGFNTTNGQVIANTGTNALTFTNGAAFYQGDVGVFVSGFFGYGVSLNLEERRIQDSSLAFDVISWSGGEALDFGFPVNFANSTDAATTRANLGFSTNLNTFWTATNSSNARSAVGLGATWLTNTNVTNFRTAIGLGVTNDVTFETVNVDQLSWEGSLVFEPETGTFWTDIGFENPTSAAQTRTNLGIPLPALTNTSNVTTMRALAGSTNTNQPYSGTISIEFDGNPPIAVVVSNGIILEVGTY
jgi:hypothetical protein